MTRHGSSGDGVKKGQSNIHEKVWSKGRMTCGEDLGFGPHKVNFHFFFVLPLNVIEDGE